jgi:ABC-2 type transport system ATP-binding protein
VAVIELHELTKRFGDLVAVDDLSFEVDSGQVVGFLGPNGAGKTTTLRMLLCLATPTEGSAIINGRPYQELDQPLHVVGAVLDTSDAHPGRSARNHLRIQAMLGEVSLSRIDEVLDLVDLTSAADRRVGEFSLGMRQRLGLAAALLTDPEILILDEPANGLDPEGAQVHTVAPDLLEVSGSSPEQIGNLAAKRSIPIFGSETESTDLEDIFLKLTNHTDSAKAPR